MNVGASTSHNPMVLHSLLQGQLYFFLYCTLSYKSYILSCHFIVGNASEIPYVFDQDMNIRVMVLTDSNFFKIMGMLCHTLNLPFRITLGIIMTLDSWGKMDEC
jgi:hypothetical protein